jgi:hypothetical protein
MIEIYVGETKNRLHKQIYGHRSDIIDNVNNIVYWHLNQSDLEKTDICNTIVSNESDVLSKT